MPDNDRLIRQCQKKSRKAFDELYRTYSGLVFGICLRYAKNRTEAEDLLQDCFIKVIDKIEYYRFEGSFEGWLRRLTVREAINSLRTNRNLCVEELREEQLAETDSINNSIIKQMNAEDILAIIDTLPTGYKTVFNLFAIEGYPHKEIAEMLGCSESTSKSQYLKAKKALVERLHKRNDNDGREF